MEKRGWVGKKIEKKSQEYVWIYSSGQSLQKIIIPSSFPQPLARAPPLPYTHITRYVPSQVLPAQSKPNQAELYNLLHQTEITPTHLKKNLALFQGNSSPALAGLSQRGWSVTCGRNIERIRFNKPKIHTQLESLSQQRPGGVTTGGLQAFLVNLPLQVQSTLFTQKLWKTNGLSSAESGGAGVRNKYWWSKCNVLK